MGSLANLEAVEEDISQEQSRIQYSQDLGEDEEVGVQPNQGSNAAMANLFAQTANQQNRGKPPRPPRSPNQPAQSPSALDSLFAATAAQQSKKKRGF